MCRSVITGPMICTACPEPHPTTDFYFVVRPEKGVECRPAYEARIARETREQVYQKPNQPTAEARA